MVYTWVLGVEWSSTFELNVHNRGRGVAESASRECDLVFWVRSVFLFICSEVSPSMV